MRLEFKYFNLAFRQVTFRELYRKILNLFIYSQTLCIRTAWYPLKCVPIVKHMDHCKQQMIEEV